MVAQTLSTGTSYTASWGGSKSTSNNSNNFYNPALTSNVALAFSQPLLQKPGPLPSTILSSMMARSHV